MPMLPTSVQADIVALDRLLKLAMELPPETPGEVRSMVCQHICVVVAGRLEQSLKTIIQVHVRQTRGVDLDRAMVRLCQAFQNPKTAKILDLIDLFDRDFKRTLQEEWDSDESGDASNLNSMVTKRINIAHQKNRHETVTMEAAASYVSLFKKVVRRVNAGLNPLNN